MIKFPNLYLTIIYRYILQHDGEQILYKNLHEQYNISYPTIRRKVKWLEERRFIRREGRKFFIIPRFSYD